MTDLKASRLSQHHGIRRMRDYGLTHGSGCIDSADGDAAPSTDIFGQARIDDPNTVNTGIGDPCYVDMGAHEYDPN